MRDKRPERPGAIEGHETREFQQGFPVIHGLNLIFIDIFIRYDLIYIRFFISLAIFCDFETPDYH